MVFASFRETHFFRAHAIEEAHHLQSISKYFYTEKLEIEAHLSQSFVTLDFKRISYFEPSPSPPSAATEVPEAGVVPGAGLRAAGT